MTRTTYTLHEEEHRDEDGFTLVEILVVIIIIGILAAVAIPIFLNQQRAARDSATTADVKNLATNVQTALASYPSSPLVALGTTTTSSEGVEEFVEDADGVIDAAVTGYSVRAFDTAARSRKQGGEIISTTKTEGTIMSMYMGAEEGQYVIRAWNRDGKEYTSPATALVYDSARGGLLDREEAGSGGENVSVRGGSFEGNVNESWASSSEAFEVDKTKAKTGSSSIKFSGSEHVELIQRDGVEVKTGETWEISGWFLTEGTKQKIGETGGLRLQVSYDGGRTWEGVGIRLSDVEVPSGGWQQRTITQTIPEGVTNIRPRIAFTAFNGWNAWVDDIEMKKVKEAS